MSWLLSPSSATKITPKLTRKASTGLDGLSARRRRGREPATSTGQPCRMPVEGLVHLQSQARGPGLITQRVDHPAWDYSPSPLLRVAVEGRFDGMKVDTGLPMSTDPRKIAAAAKEAEAQGWDGLLTAETGHDPFFPLLIAAEHTERIELGTGIAVAFARNPMIMANIGNDLQSFSQGRTILGLGSQIKAHIEKRFSMPWSHPAPRMREFVLAMRAIWASWNDGVKLDFQGDFYRHTLMTPFFNPGPNRYGTPKVFLAAVGEKMTEVDGEVCDGILLHGFTTERSVREVTLPALARGWEAGGKTRDQFEITGPMFVVTGSTEEEMAAARTGTKRQIGFFGSTPAYPGGLGRPGWGAVP